MIQEEMLNKSRHLGYRTGRDMGFSVWEGERLNGLDARVPVETEEKDAMDQYLLSQDTTGSRWIREHSGHRDHLHEQIHCRWLGSCVNVR